MTDQGTPKYIIKLVDVIFFRKSEISVSYLDEYNKLPFFRELIYRRVLFKLTLKVFFGLPVQ